MAHESFESEEVAAALNRDFVSIKVDKEERPDIDGIYMRVCQALTGGGGWPTTLFMAPDKTPFSAGTYYPKDYFLSLLRSIRQAWDSEREALLESGEKLTAALEDEHERASEVSAEGLVRQAVSMFRRSFDAQYGGFGPAPKFPSAHNLMFLLHAAPELAEKTLLSMYRGGLFDHIGGGFSRYSTDRYWLVPHFEKMLYDNALLAMAYLLAYERTGKKHYRSVALLTLEYVQRELQSPEGGFYSAQDADSDGVEGKYYVFTPDETIRVLGKEDGERFNQLYGITSQGNFEGKSIPNLLGQGEPDDTVAAMLPKLYEYRKQRTALRTDHKILTAWNALMIAAFADAYRIAGQESCLRAARRAADFLERCLTDTGAVYVSFTDDVRSRRGFLDDYAFYIFALLRLHQATLEEGYLTQAVFWMDKAVAEFYDREHGGFFFSGPGNEKLILRPKELYDGAMPSGNSVMTYNLSRMAALTHREDYDDLLKYQQTFQNGAAADYPAGYGFYLYSTLPIKEIVCATNDPAGVRSLKIRSDWAFRLTNDPCYPLLNGKTTYYVCEGSACLPPTNELKP